MSLLSCAAAAFRMPCAPPCGLRLYNQPAMCACPHPPRQSLEKAETAAAARAGGERVGESGPVMKSQKDVTLAKDLDIRDR